MSKNQKMYMHTAIGILIMLLGFVVPPFATVTPVGVRCLFTFVGMVYMWSTINPLWPSLLGLVFLGLSGYAGEGAAGFKSVFAAAFGNDTVILLMLNMVLFSAMDVLGCTKYIAKWCLTRNVINGHPYLFMAAVFITSYLMSLIVSPPTAVLIVWPIALHMMNAFGVTKKDRIWHYYFVGLFAMMCLGQPILPFKGAQVLVLNSIENLSGKQIPWGPYMLFNILIGAFMMTGYLLLLKFVIKPDVSKLQGVTVEQVSEALPLPPMNRAQKMLMVSMPVYVAVLLLPNFLGSHAGFMKIFNIIGSTGTSCLFLVFFSIVKFENKPIINYNYIASKSFNWGTIFMVAAAIYGAGTMSNAATGIKDFIVATLNPVLGNCNEITFVILMFTVAIALTSIANNAGIGLILMPVAAAFADKLGLALMPLGIGVAMMVFFSMLTPAASPHAAMAFGRDDLYEGKEMIKIGLPFSIAFILVWALIAYPIAKVLF